jgi:hypothetical protein
MEEACYWLIDTADYEYSNRVIFARHIEFRGLVCTNTSTKQKLKQMWNLLSLGSSMRVLSED